MKKLFTLFLAVVMLLCSTSINVFALTPDESQNAIDAAFESMFETVAGDVDGDGSFNAADARAALLASAGLTTELANADIADLDGDGLITAIDARLLLRVSAKLDSDEILYNAVDNSLKFDLFTALANNVKVKNYRYKYTEEQKHINMTHDNKQLADKFNKQMVPLMSEIAPDEPTGSFETLITADENTSKFRASYSSPAATKTNYPVKNNDFVSNIALSDIKSISYQTNQTLDYVHKRTSGSTDTVIEADCVKMTGLDCITIYLKDETVTVLPEDQTTLTHGKLFDLPTKDNLSVGDSLKLDGLDSPEMAELGLAMDLNAKFTKITYKGSYVKLYFDKATKTICAMEYYLGYSFGNNMYMKIKIPGAVLTLMGVLSLTGVDIDGYVNIVSNDAKRVTYIFPQNYAALTR